MDGRAVDSTTTTPLLKKQKNDEPHDTEALLIPPNYDSTTQYERMMQLKNQGLRRRSSTNKAVPQQAGLTKQGSVLKRMFDKKKQQKDDKKNKKLVVPTTTTTTNTTTAAAATLPTTTRTIPVASNIKESTTAAADNNNDNDNQRNHNHNRHHKHSFIFLMLSPQSNHWQAIIFKNFISFIIIMDMIMFILSTEPQLTGLQNGTKFFHIMEGIVSTIFLLEYIARIITIIEDKKYKSYGPIYGRLSYAFTTFSGWIDLLATAPFFIEQITGLELPKLTYIRMFRLARILKTQSYIKALDAVYRVIYYNAEIMYVAVLLCIFLTLFTAVLLYILRPEHDKYNDFTSIASTLYLSTLLLTGQGGPNSEHLPWYTKAMILLTSIFSVAIFSIPASLLTWGWEAEAERVAKNARKRAIQDTTTQSNTSNTTMCSCCTSSTSDGDTTDEEYFKMIAGADDDDDDDDNNAPWMKQLKEDFAKADIDSDGTLTIKEIRNMILSTGSSPLATASAVSTQLLSTRIDQLETKLNEQNQKLDIILNLLQQQKQR